MKHGAFVVKKVKSENKKYDWNFEAVFEDTVLARLEAKLGGICNEIESFEGSRRCGLATSLMKFCFKDPNIGTFDPGAVNVERNPAIVLLQKSEKVRNLAIANCDHMIYLICAPADIMLYTACSGYLTAALTTGHTMMFTINYGNWGVTKVSTAKDMLKNSPRGFITRYGDTWLFCKCKPNRVTQCEGLSKSDLI